MLIQKTDDSEALQPGCSDSAGDESTDDVSKADDSTGPEGANPETRTSSGAGGFVEEADPDGRRQPMARLYEDEEKVGGASRWTVSGHLSACAGCEAPLPIGDPFHTVLLPADEVDPKGLHPECSEVFSRKDFCARCFPSVKLETAFAHWATVLPPPDKPPTKIVNLASLLAYFERLLGKEEQARKVEDDPDLTEGEDSPQPATESVVLSSNAERREDQLLEYLIGLFLVRKRILKWGQLGTGFLTLVRKGKNDAPDRLYRVPAPSIGESELESAVRSFEELFS